MKLSFLTTLTGVLLATLLIQQATAEDYYGEGTPPLIRSAVRFASEGTEADFADWADGCDTDGSQDQCSSGCCACCGDPWVVSREPLFCHSYLDRLTDLANIDRGCFKMPITGGAWHWFHQSLIGNSGGYGIDGLRDTYFWYLYADPELTMDCGRKVGGHLELRLRETDTFRSFIDEQVWPWEAYAYVQDEDLGKLKAGLVYKQFGLFWDGVFFGNAPYFDGMKLDADYGLSWESTHEVDDCFKVERYLQFFFHEDVSNGSFAGADAESVLGYTEQNTGVIRIVPTWTQCNGAVVELGLSGLVGQINSKRQDLADETVSAYAVDLSYTAGPWKAFAEAAQRFGLFNPNNYVSGGPSNRVTNVLAGLHYTHGPVTYRCSYSNSITGNPYAVQNMVLAGATITLTKHLDLYLEYVNERIDGATIPGQNGDIFNGFEYVINWHF